MFPKFHTNSASTYTISPIIANYFTFYSYAYHDAKTYLLVIQQIADLLKKNDLVGTLISNTFSVRKYLLEN